MSLKLINNTMLNVTKGKSKIKLNSLFIAIVIISSLFAFISCNKENITENEEDATQYGLNETYDEVRNGVRLILSFNSDSSTFEGTIENTTANIIKGVRVEVHLSNGTELGPTTKVDLTAKETKEVSLSAVGQDFTTWSAHAEVGESGD